MTTQSIKVYRDILERDADWARQTRELARAHRVTVLNLIGSPGCGKTRLLEAVSGALGREYRFAVLEGDVETTHDAERLHALGVPVAQLLTGGGCHLSAQMVYLAFKDLPLDRLDVVIVENVGNLMCPACFDIGEDAKVALLSVTEGEDKPVKYPLLFQEAKSVLITKTDLLPHLTFDLPRCREYVREVNGSVPVFPLSARTGEGLDAWLEWLRAFRAATAAVAGQT